MIANDISIFTVIGNIFYTFKICTTYKCRLYPYSKEDSQVYTGRGQAKLKQKSNLSTLLNKRKCIPRERGESKKKKCTCFYIEVGEKVASKKKRFDSFYYAQKFIDAVLASTSTS